MKIALYCHKRERCGISGYTESLQKALMALGHEVLYVEARSPWDPDLEATVGSKPDVWHVQHEPSIMPPDEILVKYADLLRAKGCRIAITLHTEHQRTIETAKRMTKDEHGIFLHRPSLRVADPSLIPMPCPNYDQPGDRAELRKKYGFPKDAFVVSTLGFMIPWKQHEMVAEKLLPWLIQRDRTWLQVCASQHFNPDLEAYAATCRLLLSNLSASVGRRIKHVDHYPAEQELLERLYLSDLGYIWCPFHTGSASAAGAMFVSARCPVIASDSSHYSHLGEGFVRVSKDNLSVFAKMIREIGDNTKLLERLRGAQERTYRETNYLAVARKHVEHYGRLKA